MTITRIEALIRQRIAAKQVEDDAVDARRQIDTAIALAMADATKPEGSISAVFGDYKAVATYTVNRKVDSVLLKAALQNLPEEVQEAFRWSADTNLAALKKLSPAGCLLFSKFVTSKPGSTGIKITAIEEA